MKKLAYGNPYTHEEHERICYTAKDSIARYNPDTRQYEVSCRWCGQVRRRVYQYDGRSGVFCNRDCFNSYHN